MYKKAPFKDQKYKKSVLSQRHIGYSARASIRPHTALDPLPLAAFEQFGHWKYTV